MARGEVELVIGVKRDETFGMMVMVGLGGVFVEVMKDVVFRRAPFSADEGLRMLGELRMGALLDGARGRAPVDRPAVAALLSNLSAWAAAMSPVLEELDLNPMLVGPEGPVGVDCVMVFKARA
jgi:acetyltransferase